MAGLELPYSPLRQTLYTKAELFEGFDPGQPSSWARTADFAIYRHFVVEGRHAPKNPFMGMMQALHDNTITSGTLSFLAGRKRVAAVMGGHKMPRDSQPYRMVALLARRLARADFMMCSGGGPGAMEATHLGCLLANSDDGVLDKAISLLSSQPTVPNLATIVAPNGDVDEALAAAAHAWFRPAYEVALGAVNAQNSLAVPTWHYGHEPSTPFASHIGKYFQNSIREDGLLALANDGIVFAEGKAGTIQEIFQDGAQNYYKSFGRFSPMILLGQKYWTETLPVVTVLSRLFTPDDFKKFVLVTDDIDEAAAFLER